MPRFFIDTIPKDTAKITGQDALHIAKSLRLKETDQLTLCDGNGYDYLCNITAVSSKLVEVAVLQKIKNLSEPAVELVLYQALPKANKLELIVQKAVELGAVRIVPVLTSYCVSRPDESSMHKKTQRLQTIALEAAKQSGRGIIPQIGDMLTFKQAVNEMQAYNKAILFYENATQKLSSLLAPPYKRIAIMVGSEGGFSPEEATYAAENSLLTASLGSRILRCETAPLAAISAIMYSAGEF